MPHALPRPRIASLLASGTEILFALGLGGQVVAISHECDFPPEATRQPRVTRTRVSTTASSREIDEQVRAMSAAREALYEIDVPLLASLRPDVIVTQAQCDVCAVRYADVLHAVEARPELRGTQVVAFNPQSLGDIFADIARVGEAAGATLAAQALVERLQARVSAVQRVTPRERPRVVAIEWLEPIMVSGNWMPELIDLAGGDSRLTKPGQHSPTVPWQAIVEENPAVLLVMPCGFDLARTLAEAPLLQRLPSWHDLAAVRAGRVVAVDGNAYFNRSGPRMVDSLELLAHVIHPGAFPRPEAPFAALVRAPP